MAIARHASYAEADRVAEKLSRTLGRPSWLRGIGIEPGENQNYVVTVRVARGEVVPPLPDYIDGVAVRIVNRGLARALGNAQ